MAELIPILDSDNDHCGRDCPYRKPYEHPFYHHTAWCWKQMKVLEWYDYWLADCVSGDPDAYLVKIRNSGVTKPPELS
jgi:hypothetical protein